MTDSSQFRLLGERRFGPFFATQFLGAFNDNVFKNALVILIAFQVTQTGGLRPEVLVNLAGALFILPFFVFSATAGQLADKYDKARLIRALKLLEVGIAVLGGIALAQHNVALLLFTLFLFGLQSTLFGPVKYSILPRTLNEQELVGGNGIVETGTSIAILAGTIIGGLLIARSDGAGVVVPALIVAVALAGYAASRFIPAVPSADPALRIGWNPVIETWALFTIARRQRTVFLSILGISWFWFFGFMLLSQFPAYAKDTLGGNEHVATLLLAALSVGIGAGSLLCERMSGHKVELGLVPFGSIGLTVFALDLSFAGPESAGGTLAGAGAFLAHPGSTRVLFDLLMIGLFGGFFIVPLYALIQSRAEKQHQSRVIAANNVLNAVFMVVAALVAALFLQLGVTVQQLFLLTAVLNAAVATYIYALVPEFLMRFLAWLLIHSIYRVEKSGLENIPDEGPAVLVCNHVSFVDAVVIMAACRRPIRFVMDYQIFRTPVLNFIFRTGGAIPIASARASPETLERAYEEIARALEAGDLVAIFPEGRITDTGELNPFRSGISRIIEKTPVPVVPMALRGLWGSFFSRKGGRAMSRLSQLRPFSKIALAASAAWPPETVTPEGLQTEVLALRGDAR